METGRPSLGSGSRRGALPTFQASAPAALADEQLRRNLKQDTTTIRSFRASTHQGAWRLLSDHALAATAGS